MFHAHDSAQREIQEMGKNRARIRYKDETDLDVCPVAEASGYSEGTKTGFQKDPGTGKELEHGSSPSTTCIVCLSGFHYDECRTVRTYTVRSASIVKLFRKEPHSSPTLGVAFLLRLHCAHPIGFLSSTLT